MQKKSAKMAHGPDGIVVRQLCSLKAFQSGAGLGIGEILLGGGDHPAFRRGDALQQDPVQTQGQRITVGQGLAAGETGLLRNDLVAVGSAQGQQRLKAAHIL